MCFLMGNTTEYLEYYEKMSKEDLLKFMYDIDGTRDTILYYHIQKRRFLEYVEKL